MRRIVPLAFFLSLAGSAGAAELNLTLSTPAGRADEPRLLQLRRGGY